MALMYTPENPEIGNLCPDFRLPAIDGEIYARDDYKGQKALLVMFICNHCPYVKAIEERLVRLAKHFAGEKVGIVAISANDANYREEDSFENMKKRAQERGYPFPYLYDESQDVAKRFGAICTPDFFLYDETLRLAYRGRLDDSWKEEAMVKREDLKAAIQNVLHGKPAAPKQYPSMGCSIKWKAM